MVQEQRCITGLVICLVYMDDTNHEMINEILIVSELLLFNAK